MKKYIIYYTFYDGQECPANLRQYENIAGTEEELERLINDIFQHFEILDLLIKEVG